VTTPGLYGYPVLMKAGLGNMLVPWARCVLWCRDYDAQMIAPHWTKIRLGPFLRGERDKRQYQRFFNHRGGVAGIRRTILLATSTTVEDHEWQSGPRTQARGRTVVCFRGMAGAGALAGRHREVARELLRITKPRYQPAAIPDRPFVGIHVRLGDFAPASEAELTSGLHCRRIPLHWYVDTLLELRKALGKNMEAKVFSDAAGEEIEPLLRIAGTSHYEGRTAITDMLALSKAAVIVASGSAFSMWASYLGDVPALWHPGQNFSMRRTWGETDKDTEWNRARVIDDGFIGVMKH
jgi:hypothetical protein